MRYWLSWLKEKDHYEQRFENSIFDNSLALESKNFFTLSLHEHEIQEFIIEEKKEISLPINEEIQSFLQYLLKNSVFLSHYSESEKFFLGFPLIKVSFNRKASIIPLLRFSLEEIKFQSKFQSVVLNANQFMQRQLALSQFANITLVKNNPSVIFDEFLSREIFFLANEESTENMARFQQSSLFAIRFLLSFFDHLSLNTKDSLHPRQLLLEFMENIEKQVQENTKATLIRKAMIFSVSHSGTLQLQRDISEILLGQNVQKFDVSHPFIKYFIGIEKDKNLADYIWGQTHVYSLTESQQQCLRASLARKFTVISGPPGTGKTCLITDLIANRMVQSCFELSFASQKPKTCEHINVVASTNNQAVDNVIEWMNEVISDQKNTAKVLHIPIHLCRREIPLGLRIGNREKLATVMNEHLEIACNVLQDRDQNLELQRFQDLRKLLAQNRVQQQKLAETFHKQIHPQKRLLDLEHSIEQLDQNLEKFHEKNKTEDVNTFLSQHHEIIASLQKKLDEYLRKFEAVQTDLMRERITKEFDLVWKDSLEKQYLFLLTHLQEFCSEPQQALIFDVNDSETSMYQLREHVIDFRKILIRSQNKTTQYEDAMRLKNHLLQKRLQLKKERLPISKRNIKASMKDWDLLRFQAFFISAQMSEAWAFAHRDSFIQLLSSYRERIFSGNVSELSTHENLAMLAFLFPVFGCTLNSMRNFFPFDSDMIGLLIVDEASLSHPAYVIPGLYRCQKVAILGDNHQLEPILPHGLKNTVFDFDIPLQEKEFCQDDNNISVQSLSEKAVSSNMRLTEHFRCQKDIMQISNELCDYQLDILTPKARQSKASKFLSASLLYQDIVGNECLLGTSAYNLEEVTAVMNCLGQLLKYNISLHQIGIITPYLAQKGKIRSALIEKNISADEESGVFVETIHGFQGREKEIIIFSLVKAQKPNQHSNFLNRKHNMLNVAISRAQKHLIVIGSMQGLKYGKFGKILYQHLLEFGKPISTF